MYLQGNLSDQVFEKCVKAQEIYEHTPITPAILKQLCLSPNNLSDFRKINQINANNYKIKQKCQSNYFSAMDTDFKWYIVGLLYADGNLYYNKGRWGEIALQLSEVDGYILKEIGNNIYTTDYTLHFVKRTRESCSNSYRLLIRDKQIVEDLVNIGLKPRKSLTLEFPNVPEKFMRAFIHGYIDGDGCIFNGTYTSYCKLISTLSFCTFFKEFIDKELNITSRINKKSNVWIWIIQSKIALITFLDWLYSSEFKGLDRKYQKYLLIKQNNYEKE